MYQMKDRSPVITIRRYSQSATTTHSQISILGRDIVRCFENTTKCIPAGEYFAYWFKSPKFHRLVLRLIVKGHIGIELHPANYSSQLNGCFAPVSNTTLQGGLGSITACNYFYDNVPKAQCYKVIVIDNFVNSVQV